jgi:hypothetical protein
MTRSEAIALMQQQLGFRTDQATNLVTWLKLAQQTLEKGRTLPWWLRSETSYIYTTANESRLPLPTQFLREEEGSQLVYVPTDTSSDLVFLDKDFTDQLEKTYQRQTGKPEAYSLDGKYFRIFPIPDAAYQIRMVYSKKDTVLDTDVENLWLQHLPYLLMGVAGGMAASALRDQNAAAVFRGWASEGLQLMYSENEAREHTNQDYQIGGPH